MRGILILFTVAILAISGCAEKVDIEAEKAKVQSVLDQLVQAWETEDMEMVSKIFAHDDDMVTFGTTAADRFVGWEAYKEFYIEWFEAVENIDVSVRDQVIKVHASGKVAWFSEIMDWNLVAQDEPVSVEGMRFTGVLERRDGNWVIVQIHASVPVAGQVVEY